MSNILDRFPREILFDILKQCPDFSTLWALINTSGLLSSLFRARALEIVEAVLDSAIPIQVQCLMRAVIRIRTGSFEYQILDEVQRFPLTRSRPLDSPISSALLWRFVALAHKIHALAHSCIDWCLHKCSSIKPIMEADTSVDGVSDSERDFAKGLGAPSWTEEQRAILAFWRVQFFMELKVCELEGRLDWDSEDLRDLRRMTIDCFYYHGFAMGQTLTAWDFIEEAAKANSGGTLSAHPLQLPNAPEASHFGWSCEPHPAPREFEQDRRRRTLQHLAGNNSPEDSDSEDSFRPIGRCTGGLEPRHKPVVNFGREPPGPEWRNIAKETLGWEFYRSFYDNSKAGSLQYICFHPYRQFGFILWDERRMIDLGFWSSTALVDATDCYTRWLSILSEDEIAQHSELPEDEEKRSWAAVHAMYLESLQPRPPREWDLLY